MTGVIVCHCKVVRADDIRAEVRLGADSVASVAARCGASTACGGCELAVARVVVDELTRSRDGELARH